VMMRFVAIMRAIERSTVRGMSGMARIA